MNINNVRSSCCEQCPYARTTPKEYLDTRGYNGDRFAAQANMAALLPCHMDNPEGLADVHGKIRQCAGAAIFRTHIGAKLPPQLALLPENREKVFSNEEELIAHHAGITLDRARQYLQDVGLDTMIFCEAMGAASKGLITKIDECQIQ